MQGSARQNAPTQLNILWRVLAENSPSKIHTFQQPVFAPHCGPCAPCWRDFLSRPVAPGCSQCRHLIFQLGIQNFHLCYGEKRKQWTNTVQCPSPTINTDRQRKIRYLNVPKSRTTSVQWLLQLEMPLVSWTANICCSNFSFTLHDRTISVRSSTHSSIKLKLIRTDHCLHLMACHALTSHFQMSHVPQVLLCPSSTAGSHAPTHDVFLQNWKVDAPFPDFVEWFWKRQTWIPASDTSVFQFLPQGCVTDKICVVCRTVSSATLIWKRSNKVLTVLYNFKEDNVLEGVRRVPKSLETKSDKNQPQGVGASKGYCWTGNDRVQPSHC